MAGLLRKWNRVHEEMREDSLTTTPKISVIIPVYNVEDYLRPCLDSMIDQTVAAAVNILREYRPELLTEPTAEKRRILKHLPSVCFHTDGFLCIIEETSISGAKGGHSMLKQSQLDLCGRVDFYARGAAAGAGRRVFVCVCGVRGLLPGAGRTSCCRGLTCGGSRRGCVCRPGRWRGRSARRPSGQ